MRPLPDYISACNLINETLFKEINKNILIFIILYRIIFIIYRGDTYIIRRYLIPSPKKMKTAAVIPAYMEEATIAEVVRRTREYVDCVVVVDDGSMDDTSKNASGADLVIRHPVNMNKGFSMITGIEAAIREGADVIIAIDADDQHDPSDIPRFLDLLRENGLDIVFGSRALNKNMPPILRFGNWFLTNTTYFLYGIRVSDTQSGYRAFTKEAYRKIKWTSRDYRVETEMIINTARNKLRYKELTIKTRYLSAHKGTTVVDGVKIFTSLLAWKITR
jgi:glycosyltransferase involved in cell wall biosynthesis